MIRLAAIALAAVLAVSCYHVGQLVHLMSARRDATAPAIYAERCSSCHGDMGRGDGLAGRSLAPRPRDFGDAAWQHATSDERIRTVIRRGGSAMRLSPTMAAHPDLSDDELDVLVAYIRSVGEVGSARADGTDRRH